MGLRTCFVSAEVAPLAKTGGLADVSAALPAALRELGHDVRVFMPFYRSIDRERFRAVPVEFIRDVPLGLGPRTFSVYVTELPDSGLPIYLIDCPELYDRDGIYTSDPDEGLRFAGLSRATTVCCQQMGWGPDVFHCNDWHAALLPLYLRTRARWDGLFARARTVLTIHNVGYQGVFGADLLPALDLTEYADLFFQPDLAAGAINFLKTGVLYSDLLTTVSPNHAREIQTPELGMGLDDLLRLRSDHLVGILNGIDTREWDPATDPLLPHRYSARDLTGKKANRAALLADLGLAPDPAGPVFGLVSRLVRQKGIELVADALPGLVSGNDCRVALLGSGDPGLEEALTRVEGRFPGRVSFFRGYSNELAHRIEAGADVFLMPSIYEPCGLNQMYSQRYGTPPIVRRTGGLADSVEHFDRATGRGTGFVFDHPTGYGLGWAIGEALAAWAEPEAWKRLMANGMARDFSWKKQALRYVELYERLVAR